MVRGIRPTKTAVVTAKLDPNEKEKLQNRNLVNIRLTDDYKENTIDFNE